MSTVLMTGFPGFLGSALLPRVLARRPGSTMVCLVQERHLDTARDRLADIEQVHTDIAGRTELVVGDITVPGSGPGRGRNQASTRCGTSPPSTTSQCRSRLRGR